MMIFMDLFSQRTCPITPSSVSGIHTELVLCLHFCVSLSAVASQEEDMGQFETVEPLEESSTSLVSSSTSAYSYFPVDVVVYVRVQVPAIIHTVQFLLRTFILKSATININSINKFNSGSHFHHSCSIIDGLWIYSVSSVPGCYLSACKEIH